MDVVLIQMISFLSVVLFVTGLQALMNRKAGERTNTVKPLVFNMFENEIRALSAAVSPQTEMMFPGQTLQIRNDLVAAALQVDVREVRGLQALAALILGFLSGLLVFLVALNPLYAAAGFVFFAILGWVAPVVWVSGAARRRKDAMSRAMPYAIDLITVAMQAGQDFGAALRLLVKEGLKGPLTQEFAVALKETELGKSRIEALKAMAVRIQLDEFKSLVTAVVQSTEMGASIAQTMKLQAEEIRRARYHKAERQAARAPSLMILPTALFILPAVFIIIFTPVAIRMMDSGIIQFMKR